MANETIEILKLLIDNQDKIFSIRQISIKRNINYKSAYNVIQKLKKEKIISSEKIGNTTNIFFNKSFNSTVYLAETERKKTFLKNKNFNIIHSTLQSLPFPLIALAFGSQVTNTATKKSDIDLFIITNNKEIVEEELAILPLNLHLTIVSYAEFSELLKSRELQVLHTLGKKNIIIQGIEEYYRLISCVETETNRPGTL